MVKRGWCLGKDARGYTLTRADDDPGTATKQQMGADFIADVDHLDIMNQASSDARAFLTQVGKVKEWKPLLQELMDMESFSNALKDILAKKGKKQRGVGRQIEGRGGGW